MRGKQSEKDITYLLCNSKEQYSRRKASSNRHYKFYIDINKEIKKYRKSIKIIEKKFVPIWLEKAYRFEGCMYTKIKNRTYIGKTVSKI